VERRRYRFDAWDLQETIDKAKSLLKLYSNQDSTAPPLLRIPDAIVLSVRDRNWAKETHSSDDYACDAFLDWIDAKSLTYWHELTKSTCIGYKNYLINKNYAYDTIRLYFWVLRRASSWMSMQYPDHYRDICKGIKLRKFDSKKREYRQQEFLSVHEVLYFMDHLMRRNKPTLLLGAGFQGLCCMQLLEVVRLQGKDVDIQSGTVTIQNSVKNESRIRRIPIPQIMIALLRRFMPDKKAEFIVHTHRTQSGYSRGLINEFNRWGKRILPKNLRNTLPTTSYQGGWHRAIHGACGEHGYTSALCRGRY
jgi:integrase